MTQTPSHSAMSFPVRGGRALWSQVKEFAGLGGDATYLWPRWLVLRAVGLVYIFAFWNIVKEGQALIGPDGIVPASALLQHLREVFPNAITAFFRAPSLLWINNGAGMFMLLSWTGLAAAVAVVLNIAPRWALAACWVIFLSFVTVFTIFSSTQMDQLILEVALLCIPFAPGGLRPGLGRHAPPRPIALFMVRWFLFRVMFESGLFKIISGDSHWRDLTAMDIMYETAPFPTILGYFDHQMSHAYHVLEIALTFAAEIIAPVLMIFAGRRGRWFAFVVWTIFQLGIQLTANFGWLNTAAMGLGLVLLDDQMLQALAGRMRLNRLREFLTNTAQATAMPAIARWKTYLLRGALWAHFCLAIYDVFLVITLGTVDLSDDTNRPLSQAFRVFRSANTYTLYAGFTPNRYGVEFVGSNDGGVTWRPYRYPNFPQATDQICDFIAPRFLRFEATAQVIASLRNRTSTFSLIALKLIERDPRITALFVEDPFPDRPAQLIRMRRYQLKFTDLNTWRTTGDYWHKEYLDDYSPMFVVDRDGRVFQTSSGVESARVQADYGNPSAQNYLGSCYLTGRGVPKDLREAQHWFQLAADQGLAAAQFNLGALYADDSRQFPDWKQAIHWFRLAAEQGWVDAQLNLGVIYAQDAGVPQNLTESSRWFRRAAEQGSLAAQYQLGVYYANGRGVPQDEIEALAWFELAAQSGDPESVANRDFLRQRLGAAAAQEALSRSRTFLVQPKP
jgi:lipase maturation factor 1